MPDIITMAKAMGNGHPLGAVITRREIAEALEAEGYFFSSAGGSPVSCEIGLAVLDVMQEEGLWDNARATGAYFKQRLEALVERFPFVGAAHGSGFYLGLEWVRDRTTLEPATEETALLCNRLRDLSIFMHVASSVIRRFLSAKSVRRFSIAALACSHCPFDGLLEP